MSALAPTDTGVASPDFPPVDPGVVLARAQALMRAATEGTMPRALRGKRIGVLSTTEDDPNVDFLAHAASELGARVTHVRSSLTVTSSPAEIAEMARMLGRLYDAVDLQGTGAEVVRRMSQASGVPVFGGVASPQHPIARLAARLEGAASVEQARRFVLQAVLLTALS